MYHIFNRFLDRRSGLRSPLLLAVAAVLLSVGCGPRREQPAGADSAPSAPDSSQPEVADPAEKVWDLRGLDEEELSAAIATAPTRAAVEEVIVSGEAIDGKLLEPLLQLPRLKRLKTENTRLGDAFVSRLAEVGQLELLYLLDASGLTAAGVESLGEMRRLRNLRVSGPAVDDESVAGLASLENLAALSLQETAVTDAGIAELTGLEQLRELSLYGTPVTGTSLVEIAEFPRLSKLMLRRTDVTGEAAEPLARMPVVDLELAETPFSNAGMEAVGRMPQLQKLNLWLTEVDDRGLEPLRGNEALTSLNLDNLPGVTDRGMDVVATLTNLEFLHLGKTGVTEAGLGKLDGLTKLRTLHITDLGVSPEGVEGLREMLPALEQLIAGDRNLAAD